jgi:hypothetical protein
MKIKVIIAVVIALMGIAGADAVNPMQNCEQTKDSKKLVLYYSQTGATKLVAEELCRQLGDAEIAAIEVENPYPSDYDSTIKRWRTELDEGVTPDIKPLTVSLDNYSTIFLGFPIWGGKYALPIATFIKEYNLVGKKIVTFATFGSGGIGSATNSLGTALPDANVVKGYGVRNARLGCAPAEIARFLAENGYVDNEVEALPDYSEQAPVTQDDICIFKTACNGYKFPLGEPVSVGKRNTPDGEEYKFIAKSTTPDGKEGLSTIYILVPAAKGAVPEFTLVER